MSTKPVIVFILVVMLMLSLTLGSTAQSKNEEPAGTLKFKEGRTTVYDVELSSFHCKYREWIPDIEGGMLERQKYRIYRDWLLKMRWSMECIGVNARQEYEFEVTIEVLKCEIKNSKEAILFYDGQDLNTAHSKDGRALKAVHKLTGQTFILEMNKYGQIIGVKGMDQAGKKKFHVGRA
ncbi:DUF6263 family protein [Planctomycetota bacterium]